ncbi:efflux RND transporter permease subunit [Rhizomicrobium electricum]|uniref:Efflux RND transporter permease subunit n=1 Tax=Rhizomicrobium electricum TaxID=480070 RepID=A0ABN1EMU2_9PROT|nr:efflux RND transporter permease subunit [Rhizomicrobium electricum]NIJ47006.1 multidrug efflux pump subunit AcrB [Rhizomicrobium electricum]
MKLGFSGKLTRATIGSPLTPLFLMAAVVFGLIAVITIPREEEPQISVPMVDIFVTADGLKGPDAAELVTKPLEEIVKGIPGVEHVYSQTQDDRVVVTARFLTGTNEDEAIVRVQAKVRANYNRIPLGIPEPLIVARGINDVAVEVLTLSPTPEAAPHWNEKDLYQLATKVQAELAKVDNVGLTYIQGGSADEISVEPDPEKLALYGVTLQQLEAKIKGANQAFLAGQLRDSGRMVEAVAGKTLNGLPDIGLLLVTTRDGRPVYVRDLATVIVGPSPAEHRVWSINRVGKSWSTVPAVSIAFAKRNGANAVVVAEQLIERTNTLRGNIIPAGINAEVTRDYGKTANDKANELLFHLGLATVSIVLLIGFVVGWREAAVTLIVIPTTILLTLFAANLMGYTINRVSLFALIFSIGILVDDAIVVIENIARHWDMNDGRTRLQAAIQAVAEVGNPTIVATLTVIAALLPMMFVSGMMGPYMAPIPANASAAMLFSFFVAMVVAPWALLKLSGKDGKGSLKDEPHTEGAIGRFYRRIAGPIISSRENSKKFLKYVAIATGLVCILFVTKNVTVKLLPFDNKSELSVMVDLPEGATVEDTARVLFEAAAVAQRLPEVTSIQAYAGTPAPFNFNGLVRHSYLREKPEMGELQVNLTDKSARSRESHAIALDLRKQLANVKLPAGAVIKVVEVPPGPPVLSTLLAEIYGPDSKTRRAEAEEVKKLFKSVPFIVDVDDSYGQPRPRLRVTIDQDKLEYFGVEQSDVYDTLKAILGGVAVGYSHRGEDRDPMKIVVRLPKNDLEWTRKLESTPIPANAIPGNKAVVELGDIVHIDREPGTPTIFRRDMHYADMVTAELAGAYEAPIYGMGAVNDLIKKHDWKGLPQPQILLHGQPTDETKPSLLWDGEWEVTYVTFRDMGAAFGVALLGIYILVVAQFGSFKLPLVILTPVPLTLIGIVIGHWLFGAPFTATSMIGFIALAGIIVRNSILLVDFIRHGQHGDKPFKQVLLDAGATRFRPILLTALAAMIGAATILTDPIFQGLAISLLFGLASSTLLTVLVIPAIYVWLRDPERPQPPAPSRLHRAMERAGASASTIWRNDAEPRLRRGLDVLLVRRDRIAVWLKPVLMKLWSYLVRIFWSWEHRAAGFIARRRAH